MNLFAPVIDSRNGFTWILLYLLYWDSGFFFARAICDAASKLQIVRPNPFANEIFNRLFTPDEDFFRG